MIPHPIPTRPWERVGADIFDLDNEKYFILVDYYSNFFEISKLSTMTSNTIIQICKNLFARYGIPDVLVSDSGTQFSSK